MNLSKGVFAIVLALLTLGTIAWFLFADPVARGIKEAMPRERATTSAEKGDLIPGYTSHAPVIAEPERSAIPSESPRPLNLRDGEQAAEEELGDSALTVRGTVVGAQQQTLDCRIEVTAYPRLPDAVGPTATAVPDARGRFAVEIPDAQFGPDSLPQMLIRIRGEAVCTRQTNVPRPPISDMLDLGTIRLHWGARVTGTVTTQDGESLPKVVLSLRALDTQDPGSLSPAYLNMIGFGADAQGDIDIREPIRATTWAVTSNSPGIIAVEPSEITLQPGEDRHVVFVCTLSPPIEGRVSTDQGPIGGVEVGAFNPTDGASACLSVISDEDGRFALRSNSSAEDEVLVRLNDETQFTSEPLVATWGDTGVVLRLQPRKATRLQLTRGASSAPFPAQVWLSQSDPQWPNLHFRQAECSPAGLVEIFPTSDLLVYAALDTTCYSPRPVLVSSATETVEVPLRTEPSAKLLRVTDASGAALASATVLVLLSPFERAPAATQISWGCFGGLFFLPHQPNVWMWSQASADATGSVRQPIPTIEDWTPYWRVEAPGHVTQVLPTSTERVTLESASRVACKLSGDWPERLQVHATDGVDTFRGTDRADESSIFDFDGLSPGRWTLTVSAYWMERAVGSLDVTPDGDQSIVVAAPEHVLRGGLFRAEELAWSDAAVSLLERSSGRETKLEVSTLGVRIPNLLRGDYALRVEAGGETRSASLETTLEEVIGIRLDE
ncbi:MAG: carboxypeptidase-like regulatory domain-containing protein [Planctomycetota bacterium]